MIAEKSDKFENTGLIPNLIGYSLEEAQALADENNFRLRCNDEDGIVIWQFPMSDYLSFEDDEILIAVKNSKDAKIKMADLRGLTVREGSAFLTLAGISYTVKGNGRVVSQSIKPGTSINNKTECKLECKPI